MSLISLRNIRLAFGGLPIFDDLSLDIHAGQRVCILGRNGAGKSTLLKTMQGEIKPDAGTISLAAGLHIAHLPQDVPDTPAGTAFDAAAEGAGAAGSLLAAYYRQLAAPTDPDLLHRLQHDLTVLEGWSAETRIRRALEQVQVDPNAPVASLSGGLRRRVLLARALVSEPDVLLLDEPTNHLDLEAIAWLESFLSASKRTVVFVTHDRRLLKKLATRIIELDRGRVVDWSCDYPTFLERKQAVLDNEEKEWAQFDKKLAQEEAWIRQGIRARRTRNEGRVRALLHMREERRKRRERLGRASMTVNAGDRSGDRVLKAADVAFAYGPSPIVRDFSLTLMRGDRVGVIGPNGCGKTTLLRLLLGELAPQRGRIEFGVNVQPLYFDQLRAGIEPDQTVWENVAPGGREYVTINGVSRHVIGYLQDFLFTSDRARTPVKYLSGGERHRLLLARLFSTPSNLLVCDEPTNDLDTETLELLEETLANYSGTLLVVSHDREFLNNVVTSALIFKPDATVTEYIGGYDDWERQLAARPEPPASRPAVLKQKTPPPAEKEPAPRKLGYMEKRELEALPGLIEALEAELHELRRQLADFTACRQPGFVARAKTRLAALESELEAKYARWESLESRV